MKEIDGIDHGVQVSLSKDTVEVELYYPRTSKVKFIEVGLMDVRANDGMRIHYDFGRDGWAIEQPTKLEWEADEKPDPHWKEVAFIQAWALMPGENDVGKAP